MAVFFDGRLITTPTTASVVNDDAMRNKNLSVGNVVALVGRSASGKPKTALRYGSPQQAQADLVSGELLDAVLAAFDPSNETGGPAEVVAVRVNPATQSSLALKSAGAADVISLQSTNYGALTNQIKIKVEAGSVSGRRLTTQVGSDYYSEDNVGCQAPAGYAAGLDLDLDLVGEGAVVGGLQADHVRRAGALQGKRRLGGRVDANGDHLGRAAGLVAGVEGGQHGVEQLAGDQVSLGLLRTAVTQRGLRLAGGGATDQSDDVADRQILVAHRVVIDDRRGGGRGDQAPVKENSHD
jgi:hypothetical protein